MQLTLSKKGPPMWFLGDPKNITIALNFSNPGPITLDFKSLGPLDQNKILSGLQGGILESDTPFQELYEIWLNQRPAVEEIPQGPQNAMIAAQRRIQETRVKLEAERQKKETQLRERCEFVLGCSSKAIMSSITGVKDTRFVRKLIETEANNKNRKWVIKFMNKKLQALVIANQKEIQRKIEKSYKKKIRKRYKEGTDIFSVVESDKEMIVLTANDLVEATARQKKNEAVND